MKIGDTVEWVGKVQTVGPNREIAIEPGDRRQIVNISEDGKHLMLNGKSGKGFYGFVQSKDVKTFKK